MDAGAAQARRILLPDSAERRHAAWKLFLQVGHGWEACDGWHACVRRARMVLVGTARLSSQAAVSTGESRGTAVRADTEQMSVRMDAGCARM